MVYSYFISFLWCYYRSLGKFGVFEIKPNCL